MNAMLEGIGFEAGIFRRMNWGMVLVTVALLTIGELFVYSAGVASNEPLCGKQTVWIVVGTACYLIFASSDYRNWMAWAWPCYAFCLILLVLVLIPGIGTRISGGRRWITMAGSIGIQPSEFAKIATIAVLAIRLNRSALRGADPAYWLVTFVIVGIPVLLIAAEPDFGTALVFVPVLLVMMFVAGCRKRLLALILGLMVGTAAIMLACLFLPEKLGASAETQTKIIHSLGMGTYHRDRIQVFLRPDSDPMGTGWNKRQSEIAVGSGGAFGKGYMQGTQNVLGFLPVATTDFIFSVIAEESGFAGTATVLALFGLLLWCGARAGMQARDKVGRILCSGIVTLIFFHVFVNISMTVGLLPIIGMPLPLLSYGGSFMITVMSSLGILQSVWIHSKSSVQEFVE